MRLSVAMRISPRDEEAVRDQSPIEVLQAVQEAVSKALDELGWEPSSGLTGDINVNLEWGR